MNRLLVDTPSPGALSCIVFGDLAGLDPGRLRPFRHILWCVDTTATPPALTATIERLTPDCPDAAAQLERFLRRDPRRLPALLATADAAAPAYSSVINLVYANLESAHRTRFTRQKDGFTWQRHVLENIPGYIQLRLPPAWAGALRGLPAIVCGAGPSLDVSLPALVAAAPDAVVFSADSALRALARAGVAADFAVTIDAAKVPEKCLPPDHPPFRVIATSVSPPAWRTARPASPPIFLSGPQVTDDWLSAQGVPRTALAISESCGSTALDLARHLGCDPIYLFGLDLAVDDAQRARRHQRDADPSLYTQSNYDASAALPRVPGNYTATVPCFALGDWRALDERLATRSGGQVVNVTDRGARLRGTTVVHPADFSIAPHPTGKTTPLARLNAEPENHPGVLVRLRTLGARAAADLPALHQAFAAGGPTALATAFRPFVTDPDLGRALGAFSLKLMPHLVPPIEGDEAFWASLLEEFAALAHLLQAASVRQ